MHIFKVIIVKNLFDHNPGYFEYFTTFNILKCVELNSLQRSILLLSLKLKKLRNSKIFIFIIKIKIGQEDFFSIGINSSRKFFLMIFIRSIQKNKKQGDVFC